MRGPPIGPDQSVGVDRVELECYLAVNRRGQEARMSGKIQVEQNSLCLV